MVTNRRILIPRICAVIIALGGIGSSAQAQVFLGSGYQCENPTSDCRPYLELARYGRRHGVALRVPVSSLGSSLAPTVAPDNRSSLRSVRSALSELSLVHRLTLWRTRTRGWSLAAHSVTEFGDGISALLQRDLRRLRAGAGFEWELARYGRQRHPYAALVLGLGVEIWLPIDPDRPLALASLPNAMRVALRPSVGIRIAPFRLLERLW